LTDQVPADLDGFAARFAACTLSRDEWTHAAHLVTGAWHVDRFGADEALVRLRSGIGRLNESFGNSNTATDGYHETITAAYVLLIAQFLHGCPSGTSLRDRVAALLSAPLAHKDALLEFYSKDLLMSVRARAEWVEPDVKALTAHASVR
jgi:hypothetical protein